MDSRPGGSPANPSSERTRLARRRAQIPQAAMAGFEFRHCQLVGGRRPVVALALFLLLLSCKNFPWDHEKEVAESLKCGMSIQQVAEIAERAGARFDNRGKCAYSAIEKNGGPILVAFDGVPKLVFAAEAGLIKPFGDHRWKWTVACQDQAQDCPELPISQDPRP